MPGVQINIEIEGIDEAFAKLRKIPKDARQGLEYALNDALKKGREKGAELASGKYNVSREDVLKASLLRLADELFHGAIHVTGWRIPLIDFDAVDIRPGGVQFQELRGRISTMHRAFIATMASGHTGVFHRAPKSKGSSELVGRLPIHEQVGLAIPQMVGSKDILPKIQETINTEAMRSLEAYISSKLSGK